MFLLLIVVFVLLVVGVLFDVFVFFFDVVVLLLVFIVVSVLLGCKCFIIVLVWGLFLLVLGICVVLVVLLSMELWLLVNKVCLLFNLCDIDIYLVNGNFCVNWLLQYFYVVGLVSLIIILLNIFLIFMVYDKMDYNINELSSFGKMLIIEFVNQCYYWVQQCFMLVQLVDNVDSLMMLDKCYFVINDNQLIIQNDLMNSLLDVLVQLWLV